MKKLLIGFLVLSLVLLSFISCNSNAVTLEDGVGKVSFAQAQASALKSLSMSIDYGKASEYYWRYTAKKMDAGGTSGQVYPMESGVIVENPTLDQLITASEPVSKSGDSWTTGLADTHAFSVGSWSFTLYAFKGDGSSVPSYTVDTYIYSGSQTATVVKSDNVTKVTVGVSPVSDSTKAGTGTVDFTAAEKPSGYGETSVLKYKVDEGSWFGPSTKTTSASLGSHTAYVGVFNTESDSTPLVQSQITVTVYRGLTTKISGSVDDSTTEVQFEAGMPTGEQTIQAETVQAVVKEGSTYQSPAQEITANVAPVVSSSNNTTVSIPAGAIDNDASAGDSFQSDLTVKTYAVSAASSSFTVTSANNVAVAGIDCKMTVTTTTSGGSSSENVTDFNSYITITTYILKGLASTPTIVYNGTETGDQHHNFVSYAADTGRLEFTTNHFSTFSVEVAADSYIKDTNVGFTTLQGALDVVKDGQTIVMLRDVTGDAVTYNRAGVSATLDLGGKTFKANSNGRNTQHRNVYITAGTLTIQNGTLDARGNYDTSATTRHPSEDGDMYGTVRAEGGNVILKDLKLYNNHNYGMNVKVCDNSSGEIRNCTIYSTTGGCLESEGGNIDVYDSTFTQTGENYYYDYIASSLTASYNGTVNISGSSFTTDAKYAIYAFSTGCTINISDGTYSGAGAAIITSSNGDDNNIATINVSGGTFSGAVTISDYNASKQHINISGGAFNNTTLTCPSGGDLSITGGTFDVDPSSYTVTNYAVYKSNNNYVVEAYDSSTWGDTKKIVGGTFSAEPTSTHIASGYKAKQQETEPITWKVVAVPVPSKGMLIKMDVVKDDSGLTKAFDYTTSNGEEVYRVLKVDGTKAFVMAMYETRTGDPYYPAAGPTEQTTFSDSKLSTKYQDSPLDSYLENTFYSTDNLQTKAYNAIGETDINQTAYTWNGSGTAKYNLEYKNSKALTQNIIKAVYAGYVSVGKRHVYSLDLDEVCEYINGGTSSTIYLDAIWNMFYNCNFDSTVKTNKYGPWLRTAGAGNGQTKYAWKLYANLGAYYPCAGFSACGATDCAANCPAACPAFVIDLSQFTAWVAYN